jgi:hypothetical protein
MSFRSVQVLPLRPGAPAAADLPRYVQALEESETIKSRETRNQYKAALRRLTEVLGKDVEWILGHSEEAVQMLLRAKRRDGEAMLSAAGAQTLKTLAMSVLAVLRHVPGEAAKWPGVDAVWRDFLEDTVSPVVERRYDASEVSERMEAGYVPWQDVVAKRDAVLRRAPTSVDALVLAMYTMRRGVARADFGDLRVFRPRSGDPEDPASSPNRIVWEEDPLLGGGDGTMELILTEFKTADKQQGLREELPAALTSVLAASLRRTPRKWVFERPDAGGPYSGRKFSRMVNGRLSKLFGGKPVTITMLRRSKASFLDHNVMTPGERREEADGFMHSVGMNLQYRMKIAVDEQLARKAAAAAKAHAHAQAHAQAHAHAHAHAHAARAVAVIKPTRTAVAVIKPRTAVATAKKHARRPVTKKHVPVVEKLVRRAYTTELASVQAPLRQGVRSHRDEV